MNRERHGSKLCTMWVIVFGATSCFILGATDLRAHEQQQAANGPAENLRGVVRVSWQLIDAIADDQVTVEVPFQTHFNRGMATGYVESQVDVTIQPLQAKQVQDDEITVFLVKAEGRARGNFAARSGRFQIAGPISIPFSAERAVAFDGRYFTMGEASVSASVNTRFSTVRTVRNGPLGKLTTLLATPAIERNRMGAERNASSQARQYVTDFVDQYTKEIVSQLNEVTPIEESLFRLYPDMAEWPIRVSADSEYLEAQYAPPGSPRVRLPKAPEKHAGIEIWIRTTAAEAKFLERLGQWTQAQRLLAKYLPKEGSDAGKLTSDTSVRSFGPWFVLLIGRPPIASPVETEVAPQTVPHPPSPNLAADKPRAPRILTAGSGSGRRHGEASRPAN